VGRWGRNHHVVKTWNVRELNTNVTQRTENRDKNEGHEKRAGKKQIKKASPRNYVWLPQGWHRFRAGGGGGGGNKVISNPVWSIKLADKSQWGTGQ